MKLVFSCCLAILATSATSTLGFVMKAPLSSSSSSTAKDVRRVHMTASNHNDNEDLDTKLPPSISTFLRLASTVVIGGAYFGSPVMATPPPSTSVVTAATVMDSTCLGFGCGSYQGQDFNGAPKLDSNEPNIDFPSFLKAIDEKRVEKVELLQGGNLGYATIKAAAAAAGGEGGEVASSSRLRISEGFPVDNPKAWSSPLWVVRILKDKGVPYTLDFDFNGIKTVAEKPPRTLID